MQPVTMTLPFSASAAPMAASDSACALAGDDALGIDQRLGAAEGDEAHLRRTGLGHMRVSEFVRSS